MEKRHLGFDLKIFEGVEELSDQDQSLLTRAREARIGAYAPYSGFQVGAAVLLESGEVVIGNNQENASFPSGLCAERVAVFHAGATHPGIRILSVAISASGRVQKLSIPAAPCRNCRQALLEYEQKQVYPIRILMQGAEGEVYECPSVAALLPLGFNGSYLS